MERRGAGTEKRCVPFFCAKAQSIRCPVATARDYRSLAPVRANAGFAVNRGVSYIV